MDDLLIALVIFFSPQKAVKNNSKSHRQIFLCFAFFALVNAQSNRTVNYRQLASARREKGKTHFHDCEWKIFTNSRRRQEIAF
jgi:hypothetical protein